MQIFCDYYYLRSVLSYNWVKRECEKALQLNKRIISCRYKTIKIERTKEISNEITTILQIEFENKSELANKVIAEIEKIKEKEKLGISSSKDAKEFFNRGNLFYNLNKFEEAEKEYREAIKINPDYADAHNNLGALLQNLKRYEEAEKEYREAIKINPNDILAHQNISELYFVIKDYKKSLEYAEKSLEISKEIKYKIISKFLILINLIALERKCEKEKKEFLNFIRENKGYQLTWKFETIKERIKEMKFEREILELTEEIEKFRVRK